MLAIRCCVRCWAAGSQDDVVASIEDTGECFLRNPCADGGACCDGYTGDFMRLGTPCGTVPRDPCRQSVCSGWTAECPPLATGCLQGTSLEQQVQHIFEVLGSYAAARFGDNLERMHGCGQLRHHFEPSLAAFLNSMLPHHAPRDMHAPRFVPTLVGG